MENNERVLTCVYCGQEYPQNTPSWNDKVLTDHIKICQKHPMRKAELQISKLRTALAEIIGSSDKNDKNELEQMEVALLTLQRPMKDKTPIINAIHVLLETMED